MLLLLFTVVVVVAVFVANDDMTIVFVCFVFVYMFWMSCRVASISSWSILFLARSCIRSSVKAGDFDSCGGLAARTHVCYKQRFWVICLCLFWFLQHRAKRGLVQGLAVKIKHEIKRKQVVNKTKIIS